MNACEQDVVEAIGHNLLIGEELAKAAGYPCNSNFKSTLSRLRKREILGNRAPGYFLRPAFLYLLDPDQSQDKGQD